MQRSRPSTADRRTQKENSMDLKENRGARPTRKSVFASPSKVHNVLRPRNDQVNQFSPLFQKRQKQLLSGEKK